MVGPQSARIIRMFNAKVIELSAKLVLHKLQIKDKNKARDFA